MKRGLVSITFCFIIACHAGFVAPAQAADKEAAKGTAGLRCHGRDSVFWYDGKALPPNVVCDFLHGARDPHVPFGRYRLLPDGRWQLVDWDNVPTEPQVFLPPGSLENLSSLAVEDETAKVFILSPALDGLIEGGRIEWRQDNEAVFGGKRAAVIVSAQTREELKRFQRERQALIDASAGIRDERVQAARARFIEASDPDHLLTTAASVICECAGEVRPADDLAGFKNGQHDYALIVHWKFFTRFDLPDGPGTFPGSGHFDWADARMPAYLGSILSGILIDADMKAVRIYDPFKPHVVTASPVQGAGAKRDNNEALGDYLASLAHGFQQDWGGNKDDLGWAAKALE